MSVLLLGPFALALLARAELHKDDENDGDKSCQHHHHHQHHHRRTIPAPYQNAINYHPRQRRRCPPTNSSSVAYQCLMALIIVSLLCPEPVVSCGPGRGGGRRRPPRKLTPLVFKQHVPNVSEDTLAASGLREGRLTRYHARFKELVPNYNTDIIFKDEEGTGADRLMTQRCKEKLNTLAISVMNQWPGVKLRVTEGWDEEGHHAKNSFHYEGRAVDITTSDRDRSKYGMLARLAVEAGFDWVYYESRSHIHCSVKSESSDAARSGGCFHADSMVETSDRGVIKISDVRVSDQLLSVTSDGKFAYSEVILFLDRDEKQSRDFVRLTTENGSRLVLTPGHLIYAMDEKPSDNISWYDSTRFANSVRPGHWIAVVRNNSILTFEKVISVGAERLSGFYAPLTREGNVVVNGIVVSCYAVIENEKFAHAAFGPFRLWENAKDSLRYLWRGLRVLPPRRTSNDDGNKYVIRNRDVTAPKSRQIGIHFYAKCLYFLGYYILPENYLFH